jgi:hypothetical protein
VDRLREEVAKDTNMSLNFRHLAAGKLLHMIKKAIFVQILVMKKLFGLLAFTLFLNGCDDGELTVENIDFSTVTAHECGNIIYKLKDSEALFFEVENYDTAFINDATPVGEPIVLEINDNNRVFFRSFSGNITSENICETVHPITPAVTEEWTFTGDGGTIEITSVPVIIANTEAGFEGGEKIDRYRHTVLIKNVYINRPNGTEFVANFDDFGDYVTTATPLPFNFDDNLEKCGNRITNTSGSEGITLDIDPGLIINAATTTPRIGLISSTINKLVYSLFQSQVTSAYFCNTSTPTTPILLQQWIADNLKTCVCVFVYFTSFKRGPGVFEHEIHLKNIIFRRGNSAFLLATDYKLGYLLTS